MSHDQITSELCNNHPKYIVLYIVTFDFGVPGVAVPPGIFVSPIPWPVLPFVADVLNVDTDD